MNSKHNIYSSTILGKLGLFLIIAFIPFLYVPSALAANSSSIRAVVSIPPVGHLVKEIGAEKVEVITMVPPDASPHTYEIKPSKLVQVSKADVFFRLDSGLEFENKNLDSITDTNKDMPVYDISKNVTK